MACDPRSANPRTKATARMNKIKEQGEEKEAEGYRYHHGVKTVSYHWKMPSERQQTFQSLMRPAQQGLKKVAIWD